MKKYQSYSENDAISYLKLKAKYSIMYWNQKI